MKRIFLLLGSILLASLLSGCNSTIKASLGSQFTLSPGQSARIASENLDIKFVSVTQDSRCPTGVECIQAGNITCQIEITKDNSKNSVSLMSTAGSGMTEGYTFQNYKILFSVSPYPEAGKTIAKNAYRLTITLNKLRQ